jgi:hypothetical protein
MKQIIDLSERIQTSIKAGELKCLHLHGEEFSTILINNFGDDSLYSLKGKELRDFELCALVLEHTKLHKNELTQLYFIINEVCSEYPELELLCKRVESLNIPNEIGHIQNNWKNSLKRFLDIFHTMKNRSSLVLSDIGHDTFLDRSGIKVMNHLGDLLEQINMREELMGQLTDILLEDERFTDDLPRILNYSVQQNEDDLDSDLFNLDQLYRNHPE